MRALIVGAGIAGLAAAVRLRQSGWEVLVVERAPSRRSGGYGVAFGGIGYDAAERMGVLTALRDRAFTTSELVYRRTDGRRRFTLSGPVIAATMGERSFSILRGDIESVLFEAADGEVEFRFGTTVARVEQDADSVTAHLSDGTVATGDLLIGADGLHSATRVSVFGPESDYRRDLDHRVAVYLLKNRPAELEPGQTGSISSRGRTFAVMSVGEDRTAAFFGYRTACDPQRGTDPAEVLPRVYGDMGWLVPEALAGMAEADAVYSDSISQMVVDSWSRGRVVLLGDAAWCVTLFAGYGSSLAVAGAERLGAALDEHPHDIAAALTAWERELRPEAERKQRLGRRVKGVYAPVNPVLLELTQLPLRLSSWTPVRKLIERRLQLRR